MSIPKTTWMNDAPPALRLLVFDDELLSRSQSETIWGRIYFEIGGEPFPESGWSDLVVAVTNAWLEAVLQATSGMSASTKVHFMDGPFHINIAPVAARLVSLGFAHRGIVKRSLTSPIDALLQDAISAGDKLLHICTDHGWSDDSDCSRLAANLRWAIKSLPV